MAALALAVSAIAVVAGPAVAASAAPPAVNPGRPVYLAIGDSLAAGVQSAAPTGDTEETLALFKASGFVAQFHQSLRHDFDCRPEQVSAGRGGCGSLKVVNIAQATSPGVTTASVLADGGQLDQAIALVEERNGDRSPRNDVEVISVTLGGNDLFQPAVDNCIITQATCPKILPTLFTDVATRYAQILGELRAAAGPETLILTTTYDNPLPYCTAGAAIPGSRPLGDLVLEGPILLPPPAPGLPPVSLPGFNDVIRAVSTQFDAIAVGRFGLLGAEDFVGDQDCLHPDLSGHEKIAAAFAAAIPG